jgi:hypothetical protein
VSLALKTFLTFLEGRHVLIRTDNTTVVAYINRQGGLQSPHLHTLAHIVIMWSSVHLQSLRANDVPGVLNLGAKLLSRGNPLYGEWKLHPEVANQVWMHFGIPAVDLYASIENTWDTTMGVDALAHVDTSSCVHSPHYAINRGPSPCVGTSHEGRFSILTRNGWHSGPGP